MERRELVEEQRFGPSAEVLLRVHFKISHNKKHEHVSPREEETLLLYRLSFSERRMKEKRVKAQREGKELNLKCTKSTSRRRRERHEGRRDD